MNSHTTSILVRISCDKLQYVLGSLTLLTYFYRWVVEHKRRINCTLFEDMTKLDVICCWQSRRITWKRKGGVQLTVHDAIEKYPYCQLCREIKSSFQIMASFPAQFTVSLRSWCLHFRTAYRTHFYMVLTYSQMVGEVFWFNKKIDFRQTTLELLSSMLYNQMCY